MSNNTENNRIIEELYIDLYPKLLRYATNSLGDPHLAEEAVQETFRIACAKFVQLMESQNRQGWLTNTLKHVISNTRRSQTKFNSLFMIITAAAQIPSEISEDNVDLAMYCTTVLGKENFWLVKQIIIEKKTMLEASNEIGISVNACKKRIQRAKEKLKDAIVEDFLRPLSPNRISQTYTSKGGCF